MMFTTVTDGTVYYPPGGGCMLNGLSSHAARLSDHLLNTAVWCARDIGERSEEIAAQLSAISGRDFQRLEFRLDLSEFNDAKLFVIEVQSRVRSPVAW